MNNTTISVILIAAGLAGCGAIEKMGDDINKSAKTAAEALKVSADKVALAIPGERYMRLIEDVRSSDPEKAALAKRFVEDLFNVELNKSYVATAWFEYPPGEPIFADIFSQAIGVQEAVANHVASLSLNLTSVANVITPARSIEKIRADVVADVQKALDLLTPKAKEAACPNFGGPKIVELTGGYLPVGVRISSCHEITTGVFPTGGPTAAQAPDALVNAIFRIYQENLAPNAAMTLQKTWSPFDGRQIIFVLIRARDFERVRNGLKVRALVHQVGNPTKALALGRPYEFRIEEFKKYEFSEPYKEAIYWAAHNMNDALGISADQVKLIQNLRTQLNDYEKAVKASGNSAGK